ncbi:ISCps6, transposase [Nonlabens dokdonensis DSW-6]|nr:ISCps6, transposase [Nonlabens dokdonensis DSW-6]
MLRRAKSILKTNQFTALYDKGYHTGSEFKTAHDLGIDTLVAIPAIGRKSQAPDPAYNVEHFKYDKASDSYQCPQGHELKSNGNWYKARNYKFKQYKTSACRNCPVRSLCTTSKANGKIVQRSEYKQYIEANFKRVQHQPEIYKKRQAIVEHPYGTIKRQWGFDHIITKKGIQNASADFGLIAIAYNLKRILNIIKEQGKLAFILNKQRHKAIFKLLSTFLSLFKPKIILPTHFLKIHSLHFSNVYLN